MSSLEEKLKALPGQPGVYLFKDKNGGIIYVGKAKSLKKRVASYFKPHEDVKTTILVSRLRDIDYIITKTELEALILEDELVKKYKPRYNIALKDDKAYPFIKVTVKEKWPRLMLARRKEKDGALYYGRYQGGMVRAIIRLVKKLFPIRWCHESPLVMREQPCLYYHTKNCAAPCVGKISHDNYLSLIDGIKLLLKGKMKEAKGKLEEEMRKAAENQDFERAKYFRDSLKLLAKMMGAKVEIKAKLTPAATSDLQELGKVLKLAKTPQRLECFDISNISGTNIVGSMATFVDGLPLKADYRRFKIRSLPDQNDVYAIYEIVKRRYAGSLSKKMSLPDLVVVDGGLAQVNFGRKALIEAGLGRLPIIGLAKKEEELYRPGEGRTIKLPKEAKALRLLQRIRDEAHRFAVSFHREKRERL
ncbi:MAG: excinuclease ABC subunit UvrC [bacterium]